MRRAVDYEAGLDYTNAAGGGHRGAILSRPARATAAGCRMAPEGVGVPLIAPASKARTGPIPCVHSRVLAGFNGDVMANPAQATTEAGPVDFPCL